MSTIDIYTDGSCLSNPGPGGWAVVFPHGEHSNVSGGSKYTTNNRMEIYAVYQALKIGRKLASSESPIVCIYSDSAYVVNTIDKGWLEGWSKNGWKNSSKETVANVDLWSKILFVLTQMANHGISVEVVKVKGHAGEPWNEEADILAKEAASNA